MYVNSVGSSRQCVCELHVSAAGCLQAACGLPAEALQEKVVENEGDVAAALCSIIDSHSTGGSSASTQPSFACTHPTAGDCPSPCDTIALQACSLRQHINGGSASQRGQAGL